MYNNYWMLTEFEMVGCDLTLRIGLGFVGFERDMMV